VGLCAKGHVVEIECGADGRYFLVRDALLANQY
jgi:hypothetical protein